MPRVDRVLTPSRFAEEALSEEDKISLEFMTSFEERFTNQGAYETRTIYERCVVPGSASPVLALTPDLQSRPRLGDAARLPQDAAVAYQPEGAP